MLFEHYVEGAGDEAEEVRGFKHLANTSGCMQRGVCVRLD